MAARKVVVRTSPLRWVMWSLAVVVIAVLWWMKGDDGGGAKDAPPPETVAPRVGVWIEGGTPEGFENEPPILRIGALSRTAHLAVLVGVDSGIVPLGLADLGRVDTLICARADDLIEAFRKGDLDLVALPERDAAALSAGGEGVVVAAGSSADEQFVLSRDVVKLDPARIGAYSVGVLEAPRGELAAFLRDAKVVVLEGPELRRRLAETLLDVAVLPEPFASATATASAGRVVPPADVVAGRLPTGALLVASRDAVAERRLALVRALSQLELTIRMIEKDRTAAAEIAHRFLTANEFPAPPAVFWEESLKRVPLSTSPDFAGLPPEAVDLTLLEEARALLEESLEGD